MAPEVERLVFEENIAPETEGFVSEKSVTSEESIAPRTKD